MDITTFVGLDVHGSQVSIAVAKSGRGEPEFKGESLPVMQLLGTR